MSFEKEENDKCVLLKLTEADREDVEKIRDEVEKIHRQDVSKPVIIGIGKQDFEASAAILRETFKGTNGRVALAVAKDVEQMDLESLMKARDAMTVEALNPIEIKARPEIEMLDGDAIIQREKAEVKKRERLHSSSKIPIGKNFNSKGFSNANVRRSGRRGGR